jgi:dipeptide/tripeptide permease
VQTRSPFTYLLRVAAKLPVKFETGQYEESAAEADTILREFYSRHHARLIASSMIYVFAWALGPVEIYILMRLLHVRASFEVALLVEAVGMLIERATFLLPAKLVSQEGGKALIFALLGYPASIGFAIGFLRRIKEMVWVLFGMVILTVHRMTTERSQAAAPMVRIRRVPGEDPLSGEESL